jgi:hypothetical protein
VVGLAAIIAIAGLAPPPATAAPVGDWQRVAPMNVERAGHSMVLLRNGKVLVTGGWVDPITIEPIASAEVYDPRTNTWSMVAPMHVARRYHQSVLLHSGRVFVYGQGGGEIYTPWTDRWRRVAPTLQDRDDYGWAITLLQNGEVLLLGGAEVPEVEPIGEILTPWTNSWRETAVNPGIGACCFPTIVTLPSGRVLAHGGYMTQGVPAASSEYWPKRDRWQDTFDAPGMTDGNDLVVLASGTAFLAGGVALCCSPTPDQNDAWLYDAQTHTWIDTGPMHLARQGHVTVALANGDAVVAAGFARTQATFFTERPRSAELYDASTGTWSWAGPTVFLHHGAAAAVLLGDGRVLLTGGAGSPGSGVLRGAEVYVPA